MRSTWLRGGSAVSNSPSVVARRLTRLVEGVGEHALRVLTTGSLALAEGGGERDVAKRVGGLSLARFVVEDQHLLRGDVYALDSPQASAAPSRRAARAARR